MNTELEIDDDKVIAHIVKKTDLLTQFIAGLNDTSEFDFLSFLDFCCDEIINESEEVCHEVAYGGYGPFHVSVCEYQGISVVRANEFDDKGYFLNIEDAKAEAESFAAEWPKSNFEDYY